MGQKHRREVSSAAVILIIVIQIQGVRQLTHGSADLLSHEGVPLKPDVSGQDGALAEVISIKGFSGVGISQTRHAADMEVAGIQD